MAVYKRYKGKRITRTHPAWDAASWWMEFTLRGQYVHEAVAGAHTGAGRARGVGHPRGDIRRQVQPGGEDQGILGVRRCGLRAVGEEEQGDLAARRVPLGDAQTMLR